MKFSDVIEKEIRGQWGDELEENQTGIPVIKTNNMTYEGKLDLSSLTFRSITKEKAEKSYLKYGDLLIEKSGGTKTHSVGYVNFFDDVDKKYVPNNFILSLRPNKNVANPLYLFFQLRFKYESGSINDLHNQTTGIQNLYVDKYLKQQVKIPSIKEQDSVVFVLQKIENNISRERESISSLNELIKSRFIEMFGDTRNKPTVKLGLLTSKITDGSHNPPKSVQESDYIMASSQNVSDELDLRNVRYLSKKDFDFENRRTNIQNGDLLFTIVGTIGRSHVVENEKLVFQRSVAVIKPYHEKVDSVYLKAFLSSPHGQEQIARASHGVAQMGIYLSDLKDLNIYLPTLQKQNEYKSFVYQVDKLKFI